MNKFPLYVLAFVALTLFTQCKKDDVIVDPETPVTPVTPPAKQISAIDDLKNNMNFAKYEWDAQGHLTKMTYNSGMYSTYKFTGTTVDIHLYVNDPTYYLNGTGTLNSKGLLTHVSGILFDDGENKPYSFDCEYNSSNQIIKTTAKEGDKTEVYECTWTNGNLTGLKEYRQGVLSFTSVYTYDITKLNKLGFDEWANFLESTGGCTGARNKNLLINSKRTQLSDNTLVQDATNTYELDADGYITKMIYADAVYNSNYPYKYSY